MNQIAEHTGMTVTNPDSQNFIEPALTLLEQLSARDESLIPWRDSLRHLLSEDVESAAELAVKAFSSGASLDVRRIVIDLISQIAVDNNAAGHWYETLLLMAAEGGLSHCAYNVGNLITERANTPADHALAYRYFSQAAKHATDPSLKASALVNSCASIRDGLLTGKPDWERAVEIYEQAAELGLAVGMFNAANVSCWLKDKGQFAYAARAAKWLNRLINAVEAGEAFVDIGGDAEVQQVYRSAKSRLAELHAMDQVEIVDIDFILSTAKEEPDPDRSAWLHCRGYEHRLRGTPVIAKQAAWANWLSVLTLMGWTLDSDPVALNLGPGAGDSRLLTFKRDNGAPLALAVVDHDEVENNDGVYRLVDLVETLQATHPGPCLAIGAKGLFVQVNKKDGLSSYTVFVSADENGVIDLIPIWPGASADDVAAQMEDERPRYGVHNTDEGNTIPILINALNSGRTIDGVSFPEAIYVNVGASFHTPVFDVQEAKDLGCESSTSEISAAISAVKDHFQTIKQRRRLYLA